MARMIPAKYDADTSTAEQRVFELLRKDPGTEEWTVLHSLGLARREKKPYGEIDFVVLIPDVGVLCLEIKGGRVSCRDGVWRTRDRQGKEHQLTRSPFQQAREGMFALRTALGKHFGVTDSAARVVIGYAVVFPDVESPPATPEFEPWQCVDITKLRTPISAVVREVMTEHRKLVGDRPSSAADLGRIRAFLRPDFELVIARATTIARSEERLLRLTQEQFDVIDSIERNDRCLVEGAAGTGKTVLGLEYARRAARDGERVILLCFNRLLGDWFAAQLSDDVDTKSVIAGSFHRLLREIIVNSSYANEFKEHETSFDAQTVFTESYPFFGELALTEQGAQADVLVVDEAQDLLADPALAVFNAWLRGGLSGGRWVILGDFTRQSIYGAPVSAGVTTGTEGASDLRVSAADIVSRLRKHSALFATLLLRMNCRNTRPVGEETALLSGFESLPYRLEAREALPVDYRWWKNIDEQEAALRDVLETLKADGVVDHEIVVLSPRVFKDSVASRLTADGTIVEHRPTAGTGRGRIAFSTVHAFKGMESPVVVLCDVDRMSGVDAQALLYVGMSRARSHLVVLLDERLSTEVGSAIKRRLTREWET